MGGWLSSGPRLHSGSPAAGEGRDGVVVVAAGA